MKKISNLFLLALLTLCMGLTSCDEQLDNAVIPGSVAVTSVELDKTSLTLTVGDAAVQLTATVAPEDATDKTVTWSSDKPAVATVDETGKVNAVAAGEATITATAGDMSATCTVTVYNMAANATAEDLGKLICTDGHIHASGADTDCTKDRVAKIFYVGSDAETSTTYNHGLALALEDASSSYLVWCSQTSATCLASGHQYTSATDAKGDIAGIANTDALVGHGTHTHAAASAARNYNSGTHPTGTSEWFLPSAGQWDKMATAVGGYGNLGLQEGALYWSSSERTALSAWDFNSSSGGWNYDSKANGHQVRACLAF